MNTVNAPPGHIILTVKPNHEYDLIGRKDTLNQRVHKVGIAPGDQIVVQMRPVLVQSNNGIAGTNSTLYSLPGRFYGADFINEHESQVPHELRRARAIERAAIPELAYLIDKGTMAHFKHGGENAAFYCAARGPL